jgi:hypothetical protein
MASELDPRTLLKKPQGDDCPMAPMCILSMPVKYTSDCRGCRCHATTDDEARTIERKERP